MAKAKMVRPFPTVCSRCGRTAALLVKEYGIRLCKRCMLLAANYASSDFLKAMREEGARMGINVHTGRRIAHR